MQPQTAWTREPKQIHQNTGSRSNVVERGVQYETDQKHAEIETRHLALRNAKNPDSPTTNEQMPHKHETENNEMDGPGQHLYNMLVARADPLSNG